MKNLFFRLPHLAIATQLIAHAVTVVAGGIPTLEAVVVSSDSTDLIGEASSATQGTVSAKQLENRPLLRPAEVLEVVPGLIISQHSGDGKANQYYLRGFNLDHGTDFATTLMGMPVNLPTNAHGQGYSDLQFLIPELVEQMQYRKGPYAADQGDFATAGAASIDYLHKLESPYVQATLGAGNYRRTLLAGSPELNGGNLLYALEWSGNDGPWQVPEGLNKLNGLVRFSRGSHDNGWSVAAMGYQADWNSSDQVPQSAIDSGLISRYGNLDPSDGGKTQRYSLSGEWSDKSHDRWARANVYAIDYQLNLWSNFSFCTQGCPLPGDQFEQLDRRQVYGLNAAQTWYGDWGGRATDFTLGLQSRYDDIGKVGLYATTARQISGTVREDRVGEGSAALFGENQVQWNDKFRSILGLRADFYSFDVTSDLAANSGHVDGHIVSPKLALIFGPWSKTEYYANYGYGFHSNDARGITTTIDPASKAAVTPATPLVRAKGYELGVRSAWLPHLQSTLAFWQLNMDSELVFAGDAGTTEPSAPSKRSGIEWSNYWQPTAAVTVDADLAYSRSRFAEDVSASYITLGDIRGHYIPGSIEQTASVGVSFDAGGAWSGGARLRYFGPRPLVENGAVRSQASTIVNLELGYKFDRRTKLSLEALNAFDSKVSDIDYYYDYQLPGQAASSGIVTHPSEPRNLRLTLRAGF